MDRTDRDVFLGANRYGKAETHLVRIVRDGDEHRLRDLTVGVSLSGDLDGTHLTGDNAGVLPTDTQKNTVFAFAREHGVASPEAFGLLLARHFVTSRPAVRYARVEIAEAAWRRISLDGAPAPHSFERAGGETRTALVTFDGTAARVVSGLRDLAVLSTTGSEFHGFDTDRYTTLQPTTDRVLATSVSARWRHAASDPGTLAEADWDAGYARTRADLLAGFVRTCPSLSLQQTLHAMGRAALAGRAELDEVRLSLPNLHHFLVDLEPFGLDNPGEVLWAADRPYGLIEGTVVRGDGSGGPARAAPALTVEARDQDW